MSIYMYVYIDWTEVDTTLGRCVFIKLNDALVKNRIEPHSNDNCFVNSFGRELEIVELERGAGAWSWNVVADRRLPRPRLPWPRRIHRPSSSYLVCRRPESSMPMVNVRNFEISRD